MTDIKNHYHSSKQSCHEMSATPLYDLQEVIQQYQSQPELLKLILTSKVEEDKRRAEEAKLKAKELDLYYQHNNSNSPPSSMSDLLPNVETNTKHKLLPSLNSSFSHELNSTPLYKSKSHLRASPYHIPKSRSYHSSISSISSSSVSSLSEEEEDEDDVKIIEDSNQDHQQRRQSAAAAMLAMGGTLVEPIPQDQSISQEKRNSVSKNCASPLADEEYSDEKEEAKPRRRREMQAITKIVETREFPYIDNYFWKNNGNTVQKKTGCKSIYYKCSNSNKGCSVNKTVTAKPNGEYLIKYRGCHLTECGKVERIRDL